MTFDILVYLVWIALLAGASTALFRRLERKQPRKVRIHVDRRERRSRFSGTISSR